MTSKNISYLFGVVKKIYPEGHCSAEWCRTVKMTCKNISYLSVLLEKTVLRVTVLPSDAEQSKWLARIFHICLLWLEKSILRVTVLPSVPNSQNDLQEYFISFGVVRKIYPEGHCSAERCRTVKMNCKNISYLFGVVRKICPECHCSAEHFLLLLHLYTSTTQRVSA